MPKVVIALMAVCFVLLLFFPESPAFLMKQNQILVSPITGCIVFKNTLENVTILIIFSTKNERIFDKATLLFEDISFVKKKNTRFFSK